ncbi:MAG: DNA repair protein RadC [Clostridiales bacterium]|nr:DNA repair protein RadC [Clostridiales bacterium]MDD7387570.1 DNA repair protein RadC [Bacillota bacterium]MDY6041600.1 DNA repair protein RadC [Candidatus Faecousia sp.]
MSNHDGHRERLRERFRKEGLANFQEHEVLELFLFYCLPRKDTNELGHALIKRFGSLANVLETPAEELAKLPGMGINAATFLTLIAQLERYYLMHKNDEKILASLDDCGKYLENCFRNQRNETVMLLCLDAKCKVISCNEVGQGSVNSAAVPIRRVVEMALGVNASSAILAHNHPSGLAIPSGEDIQTTRRLALALDAVEIQLVDHIIVADSDYVSLRQSGLYHPDECRISL